MIQIKIKEIVDARDALMSLSQQRLNIKTGYNISKIIKFANKELETFTKVRQEVIERLVPEGTEVTPEINQIIINELNEALGLTVDIPVNKIDLSSCTNLEMTAKDIILLDPFCIFETVSLE